MKALKQLVLPRALQFGDRNLGWHTANLTQHFSGMERLPQFLAGVVLAHFNATANSETIEPEDMENTYHCAYHEAWVLLNAFV